MATREGRLRQQVRKAAVGEVARLAGVDVRTVRRWGDSGRLRAAGRGHVWLDGAEQLRLGIAALARSIRRLVPDFDKATYRLRVFFTASHWQDPEQDWMLYPAAQRLLWEVPVWQAVKMRLADLVRAYPDEFLARALDGQRPAEIARFERQLLAMSNARRRVCYALLEERMAKQGRPVTLSAVARRAGLSVAAVHYHVHGSRVLAGLQKHGAPLGPAPAVVTGDAAE